MSKRGFWRAGRALLIVPIIAWIIATLVFIALRVIPGDPTTSLAAGISFANSCAASRRPGQVPAPYMISAGVVTAVISAVV